MSYRILVSNGEIIDKFSILEIKFLKSIDPIKTQNIIKELNELKPYFDIITKEKFIYELYIQLKNINNELWLVEDNLRIKENQSIFDRDFIDLARKVYILNDQRAKYKKEINLISKSILIEEKLYPYES